MARIKFSDLPKFSIGNTIQLVGAIYQGDDRFIMAMLPGEFPEDEDIYERVETLIMTTTEWDEFLKQTDLQEVQVSFGPEKAVLRKTQRNIDTSVSWNVFRRDGYACCYCGSDDVPLTVDHLRLWEAGGPSVEANLLSACKRCNKIRGNTEYSDWLESEKYRNLSKNLSPARIAENLSYVESIKSLELVNRVRSR